MNTERRARKRDRMPHEHPTVTSVTASPRACEGCQTWGADVMVTFGTAYDGGIQHHDMFLTTAQAHQLLEALDRVIRANMAEASR